MFITWWFHQFWIPKSHNLFLLILKSFNTQFKNRNGYSKSDGKKKDYFDEKEALEIWNFWHNVLNTIYTMVRQWCCKKIPTGKTASFGPLQISIYSLWGVFPCEMPQQKLLKPSFFSRRSFPATSLMVHSVYWWSIVFVNLSRKLFWQIDQNTRVLPTN